MPDVIREARGRAASPQRVTLCRTQRRRDRVGRTWIGARGEHTRAGGDSVDLVGQQAVHDDVCARAGDADAVERAVQAVLGPGPDLIEIAGQARELAFPPAPQERGLVEAFLDEVGERCGAVMSKGDIP